MGPIASCYKSLMCALISAVLLINSLVILSPNAQGEGHGDYPPPSDEDWIIRNDTFVSNETIFLNGNLSVEENATLTLDNVTLLMNSSLSDIHGIQVVERGTLNIFCSNITAAVDPYFFTVSANMTIERSKISRMSGGIFIYYGDVLVANCTIFNNYEYALVCSGKPVIFNNTIFSNYGGVISYSGSPILLNNTITNNENGVTCIWGGNVTLQGNQIINNTKGGILAEWVYLKAYDNTIASNDGFGIWGNFAIINATNNEIYGNSKWGIFVHNVLLILEDNDYEKDGILNQEGNVLQEWEVKIRILNTKNENVENVSLTIWDSFGKEVWSGETIGNFRMVVLREYEILNTSETLNHTPFTIEASKGTVTNSTIADIRENQNIIIVLDFEEDRVKGEYKFPLWGLVVVSGIWLFVFIMIVFGIIASIREKRRRSG